MGLGSLFKDKNVEQIVERLKAQHRAELNRYNEKLRDLQQNHEFVIFQKDEVIADRERKHQEKVQNLQDTYAIERSNASEAHRQETLQLNNRIRDNNADAERQRQQANETMKQMAADHTQVVEDLKQAHRTEISRLTHLQTEQEEKLVSSHKQRTQRLQEEVKDLNSALLTRDDEVYQGLVFSASGLPRNPDEKIRAQFLEIQQMVESLGRLTWKQDQTLWTDQVFQIIGGQHGQRVLKKSILQDLVWALLFQYVFCSPFRIFGKEGEDLEREWKEQCGEDEASSDEVTWPLPSVKAERWRYMTLKECREALTKPIPSHMDPRARVKKGFSNSISNLISELNAELGDIVNLTASEIQLIERLSKKVASTWLEFEMHRCRIVVCLTGSDVKSVAEKVTLVQKGSLALTVLPMLGRHGNVKGVELERFTAIAGCAGDSLEIS